jgi:hypothetical protein
MLNFRIYGAFIFNVLQPRDDFTFCIPHRALSLYIQNVETEAWGGNMQAATQKWDDGDAQSAVSGSIPEAAVNIGDVKPVEVVFLVSPEEFCVQVSFALVKYYVLLHVVNKL